MSCNYSTISNFGPTVKSQSNPLSYCTLTELQSGFDHTLGGNNLSGPGNTQCQIFMASYCANNWDGVCEYMAQNTQRNRFNAVKSCTDPYNPETQYNLTNGQNLIRNTASEKYLKYMSGNCQRVYQPFDPTVADSPLISKWQNSNDGKCGSTTSCITNGSCIPIYGVDAKTIDDDPVMNKILEQPWIAMDILINIYNNAVKYGNLNDLKGTKIYDFFMTKTFQQNLNKPKFGFTY